MIINPGLPSESRYTTRAELQAATRKRQTWAQKRERMLGILRDRMDELAPHAALGDRVHRQMTATPDALWTCHDGKRVPIRTMNDSHLFFAIAKGFRSEYPDSATRAAGVQALKNEALRRLAKGEV